MLNPHLFPQDARGFGEINRLVLACYDQALCANPSLQTRRSCLGGENHCIHLVAVKHAIAARINTTRCCNKDYSFTLAAKPGTEIAEGFIFNAIDRPAALIQPWRAQRLFHQRMNASNDGVSMG